MVKVAYLVKLFKYCYFLTYPFIFPDNNRYFNRLHLIFSEQNPDVKSFDLYRPSWEFLRDSPKFLSITMAQNAAVERTQCKLFSPDGNTESSGVETPAQAPRPIGKKRAKRQQEEEQILTNVAAKLKGETSGSSNAVLASALTQFANVFASGLQEWKDRQAYSNASPSLKRKYDNLLINARIQQLEEEAAAKLQQQQLQPSSMVQQPQPSSMVQQQQLQPSSMVQQHQPSPMVQQQQLQPSSMVQQQQLQPTSNNNNDDDDSTDLEFSDEEFIAETQV